MEKFRRYKLSRLEARIEEAEAYITESSAPTRENRGAVDCHGGVWSPRPTEAPSAERCRAA